MKRTVLTLIGILLTCCLLIALCELPAGRGAKTVTGTCGHNLTWTLDTGTGALTISGTGAMTDYLLSDVPWYVYRPSIQSVTIPDGVTSIGNSAFNCCWCLTDITIPDSVTSIGNWAFENCSELSDITIPASVTSIGDRAFRGCGGLADADGFVIVRKVLFSYQGNESIVKIPSGVTAVGSAAFYNCGGLTEVTIPEGVTAIGDSAFEFCRSLPGVTLPASVTEIGDRAFYDCDGLTSVTLPEGVTVIGKFAFCYCDSLSDVTIPASVTGIESSAFKDCRALTAVAFNGVPAYIGSEAFGGVTAAVTYYKDSNWPADRRRHYGGALTWIEQTREAPESAKPDDPLPVLPTTSSAPSKGCAFLKIEGKYIVQIQKSIDRINEIRLEACREGVIDPSTGLPLTPEDYVPIQWSADLEYIARIRAAEASLTMNHTRTNGSSVWFAGPDGTNGSAEVIAWNESQTMTQGIEQWYGEKEDWVNNTDGMTGHYTSMIDPKNQYVGLGTFCSDVPKYYNTTVGEFAWSISGSDTSWGSATGRIVQTLDVNYGSITSCEIVCPDVIGESTELSVAAAVTFEDYWSGQVQTGGLILMEQEKIRWSSSDDSIASVADGKVIPRSGGDVTLSATLPDGRTVSKSISVSIG